MHAQVDHRQQHEKTEQYGMLNMECLNIQLRAPLLNLMMQTCDGFRQLTGLFGKLRRFSRTCSSERNCGWKSLLQKPALRLK
jgi:hypothetical protein